MKNSKERSVIPQKLCEHIVEICEKGDDEERIELYNDDCLNVLDKIPAESVDLVVTDCPYHIVGGGCSNEAVTVGRYTQPKGILNRQRKDSHGNAYNTDSKHVSLCGLLNDADQMTYARQGQLFKHNDIEFKDWLPDIFRI